MQDEQNGASAYLTFASANGLHLALRLSDWHFALRPTGLRQTQQLEILASSLTRASPEATTAECLAWAVLSGNGAAALLLAEQLLAGKGRLESLRTAGAVTSG